MYCILMKRFFITHFAKYMFDIFSTSCTCNINLDQVFWLATGLDFSLEKYVIYY